MLPCVLGRLPPMRPHRPTPATEALAAPAAVDEPRHARMMSFRDCWDARAGAAGGNPPRRDRPLSARALPMARAWDGCVRRRVVPSKVHDDRSTVRLVM